jgi:UDP-N-acetylmuramate--alanine ligase
VTSELIVRAAKEYGHQEVYHIPEKEEVIPFLLKTVRENDAVITMGAGDIYKIGEKFILALSSEGLPKGKERT